MKTEKEIQEVLDFYNANESLLDEASAQRDNATTRRTKEVIDILANKKDVFNAEDLESRIEVALFEGNVEYDHEFCHAYDVAEKLESGFYKTNDADEDEDFDWVFKTVSKMKSYQETGDYSVMLSENECDEDEFGRDDVRRLEFLLDELGVSAEDQEYIVECIF